VLYVGQTEGKKGFTYKAKLMCKIGETWNFAFLNKNDMNKIEREDIVAKLP
jgi:hypothetical protein